MDDVLKPSAMGDIGIGRLRLRVIHDCGAAPAIDDGAAWHLPLTSYVVEIAVPRPDGVMTSYDRVVKSLLPRAGEAGPNSRILGRARPGAWSGLIWLGEPARIHRPGPVRALVWLKPSAKANAASSVA